MNVFSFVAWLCFLAMPLSAAGLAICFAFSTKSNYRRTWVVRLAYCAVALFFLLPANSLFANVILPMATGGQASNPEAGLAADGEYYIAQLDGARTRVSKESYQFLLWYEFVSFIAPGFSVVPAALASLLYPLVARRVAEFIRRGGEVGG